MAKELKAGDKVAWKSHGGTAHGHVEKKLTSDTRIKSHQVRASKEDPQYLVVSDSGSGKAAHKADALTKE
jgi:N-methylhydantoinase B/oxoprolinase/acetone carboxylase alpha subunit